MPGPQIGKTNWKKSIKRGLLATRRQLELTSQLRAAIQQLLPEEDEGNSDAYRFIFQVMALIDDLAETGADHQDIYQELWEIGEGRTYKDLNNDK